MSIRNWFRPRYRREAKPQVPAGDLIVNEKFAHGLSEWKVQTHDPNNVITIVDTVGDHALRVQVLKDDLPTLGHVRSEICRPSAMPGYWQSGDEYWVNMGVTFPSVYADSQAPEIAPYQVHGSSDSESDVPFLIHSIDDCLRLRGKGFKDVYFQKTKGKLMEITVGHRWSAWSNGMTKAYVNNVRVLEYNGRTLSAETDRVHPKFGLVQAQLLLSRFFYIHWIRIGRTVESVVT